MAAAACGTISSLTQSLNPRIDPGSALDPSGSIILVGKIEKAGIMRGVYAGINGDVIPGGFIDFAPMAARAVIVDLSPRQPSIARFPEKKTLPGMDSGLNHPP